MKISLGLSALAIALWAWSLWPHVDAGEEHLLIDLSPSVGGADAALAATRELHERIDHARCFGFGADLKPWADIAGEDAGPERSDLGAALRRLRARLSPGDRLVVFTDGEATDALPPTEEWAGIEVRWKLAPQRPRIKRLQFPAEWPAVATVRGRIELAGTGTDKGQLRLLAEPPVARASVIPLDHRRLELELEVPTAIETGLELRLAWIENERLLDERKLWIPPAGRLRWWTPTPEIRKRSTGSDAIDWAEVADEAEVWIAPAADWLQPSEWKSRARAKLLEGGVVVLSGSGATDWFGLPAEEALFRPAPDPEREWWVLLDRSGSMAESALGEARDRLRDWAAWWPESTAFRILPFAAAPDPVLDPRQPEGIAQLEAIFAHGPTRLERALAYLLDAASGPSVVVIVSDGRLPEEAEVDWEAQVARLEESGHEVLCVPVGEEPDSSRLARLGEVLGGDAELGARLFEALDRGLEDEELPQGRGRAVADALHPLPDPSPPIGLHARLRSAPGAAALIRDAAGFEILTVRRIGRGLLVGLACEPEPDWLAALAPMIRAHGKQPRLNREGEWVELRGDGAGWTVEQTEFDPIEPQLWRSGPHDPSRALELRTPAGKLLHLPAALGGEFSASSRLWRRWLQSLPAGGRSVSDLRPIPLIGALMCALFALIVRFRRP